MVMGGATSAPQLGETERAPVREAPIPPPRVIPEEQWQSLIRMLSDAIGMCINAANSRSFDDNRMRFLVQMLQAMRSEMRVAGDPDDEATTRVWFYDPNVGIANPIVDNLR
jgi:hypothetical protein